MRNNIKKCLLLLFMALWTLNASATYQMHETLIYKGQRLALFNEPLESYFNEQHPRPDFPIICTGELKGYHGTWEVKDGFLYLVSLQKPCPEANDPDVFSQEIFKQKPHIKADWVSGFLRAALEDKTLVMKFENGKLIEEEIQNNSPYDDPYGMAPVEFETPDPFIDSSEKP